MGASGAGKSTLLYSLSGMDSITSGEVTYKNKKISSLSEKQMAQLRADEPTGALNKSDSEEVLNLLAGLNTSGQSILMVTHDIRAAICGTRILYLEDGKILKSIKEL